MANRKRRTTTNARHQWTDSEKEQLILAAAQAPREFSFLVERGVSPSWFRRMRERYLQQHPEFKIPESSATTAVAVVPAKGRSTAPTEFSSLPLVEKANLIIEYRSLPNREKRPWRESHGISTSMLNYYVPRVLGANPPQNPPRLGRPPQTKIDPSQYSAIINEYNAQRPGTKSAWLAAHGLNHQSIFDFKKRLARQQLNGTSQSTPQRPQRSFIPTVHPPLVPANVPSLDDAILAMEVKRDQLNSFIAELKAMRGPR